MHILRHLLFLGIAFFVPGIQGPVRVEVSPRSQQEAESYACWAYSMLSLHDFIQDPSGNTCASSEVQKSVLRDAAQIKYGIDFTNQSEAAVFTSEGTESQIYRLISKNVHLKKKILVGGQLHPGIVPIDAKKLLSIARPNLNDLVSSIIGLGKYKKNMVRCLREFAFSRRDTLFLPLVMPNGTEKGKHLIAASVVREGDTIVIRYKDSESSDFVDDAMQRFGNVFEKGIQSLVAMSDAEFEQLLSTIVDPMMYGLLAAGTVGVSSIVAGIFTSLKTEYKHEKERDKKRAEKDKKMPASFGKYILKQTFSIRGTVKHVLFNVGC